MPLLLLLVTCDALSKQHHAIGVLDPVDSLAEQVALSPAQKRKIESYFGNLCGSRDRFDRLCFLAKRHPFMEKIDFINHACQIEEVYLQLSLKTHKHPASTYHFGADGAFLLFAISFYFPSLN